MSEERIIKNKVVLMAIKSFAAFANRSTGISHSSDKRCAIDIFETLKRNNEPYEPQEIKSWLILKADWQPKFADDVADVARKIQNGKTVRSVERGPSFKPGIIETWRKEAEDPERNSEEWRNIF